MSIKYTYKSSPRLTRCRHFLFAAALVVLSSEFASLHKQTIYAETFQKAMSVMDYCARSDPQATRLVYILTTFNHVIVARAAPIVTAPPLRDAPSAPNTPTGAMSNGSSGASDPMANFFLSHQPTANPGVPTSNPASASFTPTSTQALHPQAPQMPSLPRRDSNNPPGHSPSPGMMHSSALTPTTSAGGDLMADAEWFHFDALWENWAVPGAVANAATAAAAGGGSSSSVVPTDPALFADTTLNHFDVSGTAGEPSFATPTPPMSAAMDGRFHNGEGTIGPQGGMQIPLYPMMRFTE